MASGIRSTACTRFRPPRPCVPPEIDVLEVSTHRLSSTVTTTRRSGSPGSWPSPRQHQLETPHVLQGVGTGALRMRRDFRRPLRFLLSLRTATVLRRPKSLALLQSLKWTPAADEGARGEQLRLWRKHPDCPRIESDGGPQERRARASGRSAAKPSNGDEIQERYLRRAISEINELGDELLALGDELHVPVLGRGHPLGDVFLLKHRPVQSEIAEGVAFFGRSGQALLKALSASRSTRSPSTAPTASSSAPRIPPRPGAG